MTLAWDSLMQSLSSTPREIWAAMAGLLVSWGLTQQLKRQLSHCLTAEGRALVTRLIAFLVGIGVTYALWPSLDGGMAALTVGCASPLLWMVLVRLIGRRWPELRDALSGDRD